MVLSTTTLKDGRPCAELHDGDRAVARLYASPDGRRIRIALPEFVSLAQVRPRDQEHVIDFIRSEREAREDLTKKRREVMG